MHRQSRAVLVTATLIAAGWSTDALAVDGQIAINQARAIAGGVTPGDAPGFPITLSQPGSYVLTGNILVPDAQTTAFAISADHVTLDLNGFAIVGPVNCSGGFQPCAGTGGGAAFGIGIATTGTYFNVVVRNGTIQGLGLGVYLVGDSHVVEHVQVRSNNSNGIMIEASADLGASSVRHCTAQRNGGSGIDVGVGLVTHNTSTGNGGAGIALGIGMVSDNVVTRNGVQGLLLSGDAGYHHNVIVNNHTPGVFSGRTMRDNLCDSGACN